MLIDPSLLSVGAVEEILCENILVAEQSISGVLQFDSWQDQFRRVERWHQRTSNSLFVPHEKVSGQDDAIDYLYAFCQTAYHLRDWLQKSGTVNRASLDHLMTQTPSLRLCHDICNGSKHFSLDKDHKTTHIGILREYVPPGTNNAGGVRLRLLRVQSRKNGVNYQYIDDFMSEVVTAWRTFCATISDS